MKTKFRFLSILLVYVMIISQSAQYINSYAMSKDEYDSWKIAYINISDTTTANILKNIDTTTSTSLFSTVGFRSVSGNMVLKNQFLEVAVSENGRFTIGTTGGNLKTSDDDNKIMLYNHPNPHTSYTTVKIDGQDYEFNASRVHGGSAIQNIQGIEIQQKLSFVENPHTDNKDMVEIKYIMTNRSSEEKDAGIRIMLDTMLGENDGTPFRIDGVGECTQEMEFIGNNIPKSWRAFDSLISPKVISSGIFFMNEGERPDKVQFADWRSITDIKWEYEVMGRDITMDSAVAIYFNPKLLKSGQSITVTTYYGINEFSAEDLRPPLAIKLHDVKKAKLNSTGIAYNPITITAYIENIDRDTAKNVVAELELPNGMKIRGNEKTIVNLGDVSKRTSRQISWNVDIEPQSIDKKLKYNVVLTADNTQKKIISSDIEIPKVKIKTGIIMIHGILGGEIYAAHDVNSKYFLEGKVNGFLLRDKDYPMHYRYWVPESVTGTINDAVLNKSSIQTDVLMIMTNENGKPMTPTKAVDLNTDDDLYGADNTYGPLMQGLQDKFSTKYGKDNIHFFTYDWRMSIDEAGDKLEEFINKKKYDEVIIVAHSMGGLVASSYIQKSEMNRNKVSKLITMGTPYLGAPKALYVLGTGNMFDAEKNLVMAKPLKIMAPNLISAYELLPTEKYFSLNSTYYLAHM